MAINTKLIKVMRLILRSYGMLQVEAVLENQEYDRAMAAAKALAAFDQADAAMAESLERESDAWKIAHECLVAWSNAHLGFMSQGMASQSGTHKLTSACANNVRFMIARYEAVEKAVFLGRKLGVDVERRQEIARDYLKQASETAEIILRIQEELASESDAEPDQLTEAWNEIKQLEQSETMTHDDYSRLSMLVGLFSQIPKIVADIAKEGVDENVWNECDKFITKALTTNAFTIDMLESSAFKTAWKTWSVLQLIIASGIRSPRDGYDNTIRPLRDNVCLFIGLLLIIVRSNEKILEIKELDHHHEEVVRLRARAESWISQLGELLRDIVQLWPWRDEKAISTSRSELEAGIGVDVREIIASLRN